MAWKFFLSLAAAAFAAILFRLFLRRGDRARSTEESARRRRAPGNDGTARGASSTDASTEGQEVAASSGYDYEVFLSFRGPDTRAAFTDFLYTSLKDAGIRTFRDDEELRVGEKFAPELLQAIEQSKISIPIFSKGYASSPWCLQELVQMVECQKNGRQKIMPIFYDVAPSEVRHQIGGYAEAFRSHEKKQRYDEETIHKWKAALSAVGEINGWDLHGETDRLEGEFIRKVIQKVFNELKKAYLLVSDCLVSVDNHVDAIIEMIESQTSETQIIGIHGMGGIGKTTIAKIVYNKLSSQFMDHCFLSNIHEMSERNGIQCLQNQLISDILRMKRININNVDEGTQTIKDRLCDKRVLIFLDDVEKENCIDALVGKRNWFGRGSKIIITTRDKNVLAVAKVDHSYEMSLMDYDRSLQLFSKHAFRRDSPLDEYMDQANRVVHIAGGLPLALEVIGSLLSRTRKDMWGAILKKLADVPHADVQSKLEISYNALDAQEKHIFCDIACFFSEYNKDILVHFWEESKLFPEVTLDGLQSMSLIKINECNEVWMHDQLKCLGRELVRQQSKMKIEKQSRVWNPEEGLDLLRSQKEKRKVEALSLKFDHERGHRFTYENFERLPNLRFLQVDGLMESFCAEERLLWHEPPSNVLPTNIFQDNLKLLPHLRWLSWQDIPPTFNIANFSMENIVNLDLSWSEITHDWNGWSHLEVIKNLKVLNLAYCCLERTPNFSAHASLEHLILRGCNELVEIDRSICQLKCLVSLDVCHCEKLRRLPDELGGLEALKELLIDWTLIEEIPNCRGMQNLRIFTASHCGIITLPLSIGDLSSLKYLTLKECELLERLPDSIGNLKSLIELDISRTGIEELPDSIRNLKNLEVLKMIGSPMSKIPDALWTMEKLKEIEVKCKQPFHVKIGSGIYRNQSLRMLRLSNAKIYALPRLPESLIILRLDTLYMSTFPDLSNLTNLKKLDMRFAPRDYNEESNGHVEDLLPWWIGKLSKLEFLGLHFDYVITLPTFIGLLPQLKALHLSCSNLVEIQSELPQSLEQLEIGSSDSLQKLLDPSGLKDIQKRVCVKLNVEASVCFGWTSQANLWENLQDLRLSGLGQVLPDLSKLNKLRHLVVRNCGNLMEIQGKLPQSLEQLEIVTCKSLQKLPDLSSMKDIQIQDCMKLDVEAIFGFVQRSKVNSWEKLQDLRLFSLGKVQILADLSNLNKLRHLAVWCCDNLVEIQGKLPQSLEKLAIGLCRSLHKLSDLSSLKGLQEVDIKDCMKLNVEVTLGFAQRKQANLWENLQDLQLFGLGQVEILSDLSNSNKLRYLVVRNCGNLIEIQGLPQSLEQLEIGSCASLLKLPDLSSLKGLQEVDIKDCMKLNVEAILGFAWRSQTNLWENLQDLWLSGLGQVEILPDLSNLNKLRRLAIQNCGNLVEIRGKLPQSLEELAICSCESLQKLPDLSSLKGLQEVGIKNCVKLNVEAILDFTGGKFRRCCGRSRRKKSTWCF